MSRTLRTALAAISALLGSTAHAAAVHPANLRATTELGARLAPPDLGRQIVRRAARYRDGVEAMRRELDANPRPDDAVFLWAAAAEARRAVDWLRGRVPFDQAIEQMGRAAAITAAAGLPLRASTPGSADAIVAADFQDYTLDVRTRAARVVYPLADHEPEHVVRAALARARSLDEAVRREYLRVGGGRGVERFDDRSTAFGVAALAFNHSSTDVAQVLRWIWRSAGGGDRRVQIVRGPDGSVLVLGSSSVAHSSP